MQTYKAKLSSSWKGVWNYIISTFYVSNVKIVLLQHETYALANTQMESIFQINSVNRAETLLSMAQTEQKTLTSLIPNIPDLLIIK